MASFALLVPQAAAQADNPFDEEPSSAEQPSADAPPSEEPVASEPSEEEPASHDETPPAAPEPSNALDDVVDAVEEVVDALNLQIHGFASQGYLVSTYNNYLARSRYGSFELSEAAVNLTSQPIDQLRIGVQLFARDLGPIGNYAMKLDWFYVDYRFADWFGIRAGRTKIPFGLYNEVNDIDVARVPILLPQAMYPITSRDFLLAQTGGEIYGRIPLDVLGTLEYRAYVGTIFLDVPASQPGSPFQVTSVDVPYVVGGRVLWETPLEGLRGGASVQLLQLDFHYLAMGMPQAVALSAALWVASLEYSHDDLLLAIEYGRWHVASSDPSLLATSASERGHVMASYRVASWFYPGIYYSLLYNNVDVREGRAAQQHDFALTLRFDVADFLLVKLEWHYIRGTAALDPALNDNIPQNMLLENWGLFLAKITGYF